MSGAANACGAANARRIAVLVLAVMGFVAVGAARAEAKRPVWLPKRIAGQRVDVMVAQKNVTEKCEITEIYAETLNPAKGIGPGLTKFKTLLTSQQFAAYNTFTLKSQQVVNAQINKATAAVTLASGDALTLLLKNRLVSQGSKPQVRMAITVDDASGTRVLDTTQIFDEKSIIFPYALTPFQKGALLVALSCAP